MRKTRHADSALMLTHCLALLALTRPSRAAQTAEDLARLGHCQEAAHAFAQLGRRDPAEQAKALGECYLSIREFSQAVKLLRQAVRARPDDKQATIFLSRSQAGAGDSTEAIKTLKNWLARHGDDPDMLYWAGKFYEELASQTFEKMTTTFPNHYLVYESEGDQYLFQQQYDKALDAYQHALVEAPDAAGVHFNVATVYWRTRRLDEAEKELQAELATNPYHAQANYEMGNIHVKRGDPAKAIPYLERAVKLNPHLMEAHRSLGQALSQQKKYDEALAQFSMVAQAEPTDHTIHALLASTYRALGRTQEAEVEARKSQELLERQIQQVRRVRSGEDEPEGPLPQEH